MAASIEPHQLLSRFQLENDIQVLCLSGGGVRASCSGLILSALCKKIDAEAVDIFDKIGAASAGSLIASGLTIPDKNDPTRPMYTTAKVANFMEEYAPTVFAKSYWREITTLHGLLAPLYTKDGMTSVMKQIDPNRTLLKELIRPVSFPCLEMPVGKKKQFIPSWFNRDTAGELPVQEIVKATTAAPTFFEAQQLNGKEYIDGGLFANDPAPFLYSEAAKQYGNKQRMVSIGTGKVNWNISKRTVKDMGGLRWSEWILECLLDSQERYAKELTTNLYNDPTRYFPIQLTIDASHDALDDASPENIQYLNDTTKKWIEENDDYLNTMAKNLKVHHPHEKYAVTD